MVNALTRITAAVVGVVAGLLSVLAFSAKSAASQAVRPPYDDLRMWHRADAQTFCFAEGDSVRVYSLIRDDVLDDPQLLAVIRAHEAAHRDDLRHDRAACRGEPKAVLRSEVHAYCVSGQLEVEQGHDPMLVYVFTLTTLFDQFERFPIPREEIIAQWNRSCGERLWKAPKPNDG